jgi:hypothetical protein
MHHGQHILVAATERASRSGLVIESSVPELGVELSPHATWLKFISTRSPIARFDSPSVGNTIRARADHEQQLFET